MLNTAKQMLELFENRDQFISAVEFTASRHGFRTELIEKDYLCSLVLMHLYHDHNSSLAFKGGTLLAKVHAGFYRLSEDLDFSISIPSTSNRKQRSKNAKPLKEIVNNIPDALSIFTIAKPLAANNESRQYNATLNYESKLTGITGKILIDIGLREEHLLPTARLDARTLLLNQFTEQSMVPAFPLSCLSLEETYAEKVRAALTREKPAIRDYYDIHYATQANIIDISNDNFIELVRKKLTLPDAGVVSLGQDKINLLRSKIESELFPTLKQQNLAAFDLESIIKMLNKYYEQHLAMPA